MRRLHLTFFTFIFLISKISAQTLDLGTWNIINIKYNFNQKWSTFGEAQLRSLKFYTHYHYYEYKGAVNYKAHKNLKLTLGAGSYQTYLEGGNFVLPKNNNEFRIWPQIIIFQYFGKIKIEQRYRSEFRFTSKGFRNRFRYKFGVSCPLGKDKNGFKPFQIGVSNELFFTDKEPYFERNRFLIGFNYKPTKAINLQAGFLHQFDYKINDETGNNFLQLGIYIELYKKTSKSISSENELKDN